LFSLIKKKTQSELLPSGNICAQIGETAERKQSAIPLSES